MPFHQREELRCGTMAYSARQPRRQQGDSPSAIGLHELIASPHPLQGSPSSPQLPLTSQISPTRQAADTSGAKQSSSLRKPGATLWQRPTQMRREKRQGRRERERDGRAYTKTQDHCALQRQVELGLQTGNRVSPGPEVS